MVKFFIDCSLVESRTIPFPDYCFDLNDYVMLVGRNLNDKKYTGSLQSVRVLSTSVSNPMLKQCPDMSIDEGTFIYCYNMTCMTSIVGSGTYMYVCCVSLITCIVIML